MGKTKTEKPIRLDFDKGTREIIEVYDVSPDRRKIRTNKGWESNYKSGRIVMRSSRCYEFTSENQKEFAIKCEQELLKEKKYKNTGMFLIAKKYPIKDWMIGE